MRTVEFVAEQMCQQPADRVIPDLVYMEDRRIHTITRLKRLQKPQAASRVFNKSFLYEGIRCFADNPTRHYPNDVIPWSLVFSYR